MNSEEKIKELQEKISGLAENINTAGHEIIRLQSELDALKGEPIIRGNNSEKKTTPSRTGNLESFIGLKLIHLVGIVVLVTGISIGVKYAIDKKLVSESMRIGMAYGAGALLFILSWRLKKNYHLFSAILFSGSMATFYFTTYAAFVYYNFLPGIAAFLLMTVFTIYTTIAATGYNRQEIAILGMIGAYAIPFLISANSERIELFFSYILLINIGVVVLSFKRSWKLMGQLAMFITWILFTGWVFFSYKNSAQWTAFLFMVAYYFLFIINALAFRISRRTDLSVNEVQQVVSNNIALCIAAILLFSDGIFNEWSIAMTTGFLFLFIGTLTITISLVLTKEIILQRLTGWHALFLLILFIAFYWDGLAVTFLWIAVSVGLFIWGIISYKPWLRLASVLLIGTTLVKLLLFDSVKFNTIEKIISFIIIGVLLLLGSFYYQKFNLSQKSRENQQT